MGGGSGRGGNTIDGIGERVTGRQRERESSRPTTDDEQDSWSNKERGNVNELWTDTGGVFIKMSGNWGLLRKSGAILGVIYYNVSVEKYSRLMVEVICVYFEKDDLGFGALNCSFLSTPDESNREESL